MGWFQMIQFGGIWNGILLPDFSIKSNFQSKCKLCNLKESNFFSIFLFKKFTCLNWCSFSDWHSLLFLWDLWLPEALSLKNTLVSSIILLVVNYLPVVAGGLNIEGESDSWDFGVGLSQWSLSILTLSIWLHHFTYWCNLGSKIYKSSWN